MLIYEQQYAKKLFMSYFVNRVVPDKTAHVSLEKVPIEHCLNSYDKHIHVLGSEY